MIECLYIQILLLKFNCFTIELLFAIVLRIKSCPIRTKRNVTLPCVNTVEHLPACLPNIILPNIIFKILFIIQKQEFV